MATEEDNVKWQSVKWPDGARYEGLVKDEVCHTRGVFHFPDGDRYLGEFNDNQMQGHGVYVWSTGTLYRGQWGNSMMHGCGVKISKQPGGKFIAEEGEFSNDDWLGATSACSLEDARRAAAEADTAAAMARAFELDKPAPRVMPTGPLPATAAATAPGGDQVPDGPLQALQSQLQAAQAAAQDGFTKLRHKLTSLTQH